MPTLQHTSTVISALFLSQTSLKYFFLLKTLFTGRFVYTVNSLTFVFVYSVLNIFGQTFANHTLTLGHYGSFLDSILGGAAES